MSNANIRIIAGTIINWDSWNAKKIPKKKCDVIVTKILVIIAYKQL